MRRIPSFAALRAFEAAARLESFALASAELHLTASAISHQVRALEEHFGRPLFVRRSRQVEPTADGRRLLGRLTGIFDLLEAACTELSPAPHTQTLAIHCAPSFAAKWLGPRLPSFIRQHPTISLRLSSSADPIDLARQDDLDLAIAYGTVPPRPGIVAEPLGTELIVALAAPALAAEWDPSDPSSRRPVLIDSVISPVRWPDWFALNALPAPAPSAEPSFDRGALAVSAAVQGLGATLESTRFAEAELASGALVPIGGTRFRSVPRALHFLCYRAAQREQPKISAFRLWLKNTVAD